MIVTRIQVKYCFLSSVLLFYLYLTQSITVQTISGTGSLRIGANFLVCELFFCWPMQYNLSYFPTLIIVINTLLLALPLPL